MVEVIEDHLHLASQWLLVGPVNLGIPPLEDEDEDQGMSSSTGGRASAVELTDGASLSDGAASSGETTLSGGGGE